LMIEPCASATPPPIGGRFMTTKPARSRWRTTRSAAMGGHVFVCRVDTFPALKPQREGDGVGQVFRVGGGHPSQRPDVGAGGQYRGKSPRRPRTG
jgi:hypothetical protein